MYENKESTNDIKRINVKKVWQIRDTNLNKNIWNHFLDYDYYSMGFFSVDLNIDLSKFNSSEEIFKKLEETRTNASIKEECHNIYTFINDMKKGDIIVISPEKNLVYGIGIIVSDYISPKKSNVPLYYNLVHSRKVKWLYKNSMEVEKYTFSNKTIDTIKAEKWNKIILSYTDKDIKQKFLKLLINNYKETDGHDFTSDNYYKQVSDNFNKNLDEIIIDVNNGVVDVDRIIDEIILPKDTIFKEPIGSLKAIFMAKPYYKTEDDLKSLAKSYVKLLELFRYENDEEILANSLDNAGNNDIFKGIALPKLSASLMYLNLSKYSVINNKSKNALELISKLLEYDFSITYEKITGNYLKDNKCIRRLVEYLKNNTEIDCYEDFERFCFHTNYLSQYFPIYFFKKDIQKRVDNENKNLIYFGAPGTGKSYKLNQDKEKLNCDEERITFHQDYSYANFVGTYKPIMKKDENGNKTKDITYDFVPGPFIRTLVRAFKNPEKNFLLIIEEINRANVAAVFGDVFQLLDREKEEGKEFPVGASEYPIQTSEDLKDYLNDVFKNKENDLSKYNYKKIWIPENMYLWATMNSADQGVFPMDTAFKRRWDFQYVGVDENESDIIYHIGNDNTEINWNSLRKAINKELLSYNINEDKLLGSHFIQDNLDDENFNKVFKNKVLMYLFEDVGRAKRSKIFSNVEKNENVLYSEICEIFDKEGLNVFNEDIQKRYEEINKESD